MANKKTLPKKFTSPAPSRHLKKATYRSFRLSKRIKHPKGKLPSAFKLFRSSIKHLLAYKKLYLAIVLVYLLLTIVLVKGFGFSTNIPELRSFFGQAFNGTKGTLT